MHRALWPLPALILLSTVTPSAAIEPNIARVLEKMDPTTRLIQVCDIAVIARTSTARDGRTEHAAIDAIKRADIIGNTARGDGGAFRRKGKWYAFSYSCTVSPDHMKVTGLTLNVKRLIPESEWAADNLYP